MHLQAAGMLRRRFAANAEASQTMGRWQYRPRSPGDRWQMATSARFLEAAIGWYFHGGDYLELENPTQAGALFCPLTGRIAPAGYALYTVSSLMRGRAVRRVVNVLPADDGLPSLGKVYWATAENVPGVITCCVAGSNYQPTPKQVRVVIPTSWSGKTQVQSTTGLVPGDFAPDESVNVYFEQARTGTKETIAIGEDRVFDRVVDLDGLTLVRLMREGVALPKNSLPTTPAPSPFQSVRSSACATISDKRAASRDQLIPLPIRHLRMESLGSGYAVREGEATAETIGDAEYVVPCDVDSFFMDVSESGGASGPIGAILQRSWSAEVELVFWVRPAAMDKSDRSVSLGVAFGKKKTALRLRSNQWQRVCLRTSPDNPVSQVIFYGIDVGQEGLSYEFNGFSFREPDANTVAAFARTAADSGEMRLILLGRPGRVGQYRVPFSEPTLVSGVDAGSAMVKWRYIEAAQTLALTGIGYPEAVEAEALASLPQALRDRCEAKGLVPVIATVRMD